MTEQTRQTIEAVMKCDATMSLDERERLHAALDAREQEKKPATPEWMSITDARKAMGLSRSSIWRRIGNGDLKAVYNGSTQARGVTVESVNALMTRKAEQAPFPRAKKQA